MNYDELVKQLRDPYQHEKPIDEAADAITTLQAELEQCRKDAERYRFLKRDGGQDCKIELMEQSEEDGEFYGVTLIKGDYIDAAIDKAMESV